jgi:hypothetical protein
MLHRDPWPQDAMWAVSLQSPFRSASPKSRRRVDADDGLAVKGEIVLFDLVDWVCAAHDRPRKKVASLPVCVSGHRVPSGFLRQRLISKAHAKIMADASTVPTPEEIGKIGGGNFSRVFDAATAGHGRARLSCPVQRCNSTYWLIQY